MYKTKKNKNILTQKLIIGINLLFILTIQLINIKIKFIGKSTKNIKKLILKCSNSVII